MTRRLLQILLAVLGAVVIVRLGLLGIVFGSSWLPGTAPAGPTLDSEYRFLSVAAAVLGALLLWVARAPERQPVLLHVLLGGTFAGGWVRLASALAVGWPERPALVATAIELILPLIAWALWVRIRTRR